MNYVLFFITVPSLYPVCYSGWVCVNLTTGPEFSLELVGTSKTMCPSLLLEDFHFKKRPGDTRHRGAIAAVGRKSMTLRATVLGQVLSDKHRSLQHPQREYHDSGQALKPALTSSDTSHRLYQQAVCFRR